MEDETKPPFEGKPTPAAAGLSLDSQVGKVSVRAWIVVLVVLTVCGMSVMKLKVEEPLYTLVGLTVGYYFGQNQRAPTNRTN